MASSLARQFSNTIRMTNIGKEFLMLEKGLSIKVENWENIKDFIAKLDSKIEELKKSRENWKARCLKAEAKLKEIKK